MKDKRIYGLDIIRAIAILGVLIDHALFQATNTWNTIGLFDSVNLFFVLSGFLIGTILIRVFDKPVSFKNISNFWYRRWLRTLPAYIVVLTLILLINFFIGTATNQSWKSYLFIQDMFAVNAKTSYFPEAWSLAIEEWFYLLIPIALYILIKIFNIKSKVAIPFLIFSIIAIETFLRIHKGAYISDFGIWNLLIREATIYRFDSIMYGVLGAYLIKYNLRFSAKLFFYIGISIWLITLFCFQPLYTSFNKTFNYWLLPLQCLATLFMLPFMNNIKTGKGIVYKFLTYVADISYSLYLVNLTLFSILARHLPSSVFKSFLCIAFSFIVAHILNRLVERPFMKLRDRKAVRKQKKQYATTAVFNLISDTGNNK